MAIIRITDYVTGEVKEWEITTTAATIALGKEVIQDSFDMFIEIRKNAKFVNEQQPILKIETHNPLNNDNEKEIEIALYKFIRRLNIMLYKQDGLIPKY